LLQTALDPFMEREEAARLASERRRADSGFARIWDRFRDSVGGRRLLLQAFSIMRDIHEMIYQIYINYSIQTALAG